MKKKEKKHNHKHKAIIVVFNCDCGDQILASVPVHLEGLLSVHKPENN